MTFTVWISVHVQRNIYYMSDVFLETEAAVMNAWGWRV